MPFPEPKFQNRQTEWRLRLQLFDPEGDILLFGRYLSRLRLRD